MFKLMGKKIIAILRKLFLLNWPYENQWNLLHFEVFSLAKDSTDKWYIILFILFKLTFLKQQNILIALMWHFCEENIHITGILEVTDFPPSSATFFHIM